MWEVHCTGWLGRTFCVLERNSVLTELRMRWTREQADFDLGGHDFLITRESRWSGEFSLESGGDVFASASKPSAFRRRFVLQIEDQEFELTVRSAFTRAFDLYQGRNKVGSVEPLSLWKRGALVELPEELDPAVRVFVTWLVLMLWGRSSAAAASS